MSNSNVAKLHTGEPVEFECGCGEIAQTQGLSAPPTGWKRTLNLANWPGRCVTWRCGACAAEKTGGTE